MSSTDNPNVFDATAANFESEVIAGPTAFAKDRRDGARSSLFIKFDGKTHTLMPGVYTWDGKAGM